MTTFNTGNPVPSTDGRDLSDNAETIDLFVDGSTETTTTRTGKNVITRRGLEAQYVFTAINNGVWAAGQTFTAVNQFMVFTGTAFKPKNSTTLPYIVGATPVGDSNVEVVGNLSTAQGDSRYTPNFKNIVDLKAGTLANGALVDMTSLVGTKVFWQGYHVQSDGGSNWGIIKSGAHTDDGGSIFSIDASTFVEANLKGGRINVLKFGPKGDGVQVDHTFIQSAEDFARPLKRKLFFPSPSVEYRTEAPIIGGTFTHWEGENANMFIVKYGNTKSGLPLRIAPERPAVNDVMDVDAVLIIDHADNAFSVHVTLNNIYLKNATSNATAVKYSLYIPRVFFFKSNRITMEGTDFGFFSFVIFLSGLKNPHAISCADTGYMISDDGTGSGSGTSFKMTRPYAQDCATGYDIFGLVYSSMDTPACDGATAIAYFFTSCKGYTVTSLGMEKIVTGTNGILISNSRMTINGVSDFNVSPSLSSLTLTSGSRVTINDAVFSDYVTPASAFNLIVEGGSHLISNNTSFPTNGNSFVSYSSGSTQIDTFGGVITRSNSAGSQVIDIADTILTDANTGVLEFGNAAPAGGSDTVKIGDTAGILFLARAGTATTAVASFINNNGAVGAIQTSGTSTIFLTSSDPRLKSDFTPFDPVEAWVKFDQILANSGKFHFNADPSKEVWGFNAHGLVDAGLDIGFDGKGPRGLDIGESYKEAVYNDEEKLIDDGLVTSAGVDQSKAVPYLIAVIADLRNRIIALESK